MASSPARSRRASASTRSSPSGSRAAPRASSIASYCCWRSIAASASASPIGSSPSNGYGSPKGRSGRAAWRLPARRAMSIWSRSSRSRSSMSGEARRASAGDMLLSSDRHLRRLAMEVLDEIVHVLDAGREVAPVLRHEPVAKSSVTSAPVACFSRSALRSRTMSRTPSRSSGVTRSHALLQPWKYVCEHLAGAAQSVSSSKASRASSSMNS